MNKLKKWIAVALGGVAAERRVLYNILLHDEQQEPHRVSPHHFNFTPAGDQPEPFEAFNK